MGTARVRAACLGVLLSFPAFSAVAQTPPPPPPPPPAAAPAPATAPPPAQPAPAPAPQAQPAPAQQPPPPVYPQQPAYPQPAYPPPPPGYPPYYGQPYSPQPVPTGPRYPDDAATQASPFVDALIFGTFADKRFSDALMFGGQLGGYLAGRIRLTLRVVVPTDAEDNSYTDLYYGSAPVIELPSVMFGGTVGVVVSQRSKFLFAPGFTVNRTDVADYGTIIGVDFPFEWVMRGGVRFGFDAAVGRGLGGSVRYRCIPSGLPGSCVAGDENTQDRDSGIVFMVGFMVGYGFGYPDPEPEPAAAPGAAPPYGAQPAPAR